MLKSAHQISSHIFAVSADSNCLLPAHFDMLSAGTSLQYLQTAIFVYLSACCSTMSCIPVRQRLLRSFLTAHADMLCIRVLQYYELAFLYYIGYYVLASVLLLVTLSSAVLSTSKLHGIRQELFRSVGKQSLTPLVHCGRVRSDTSLATNMTVLCKQQQRITALHYTAIYCKYQSWK